MIFKVDKLLSRSFVKFLSANGIILFKGYFNLPALMKFTFVRFSDSDSVSMITLVVTCIGFTKRISVSILLPSSLPNACYSQCFLSLQLCFIREYKVVKRYWFLSRNKFYAVRGLRYFLKSWKIMQHNHHEDKH